VCYLTQLFFYFFPLTDFMGLASGRIRVMLDGGPIQLSFEALAQLPGEMRKKLVGASVIAPTFS
jgi:hypothetical protein